MSMIPCFLTIQKNTADAELTRVKSNQQVHQAVIWWNVAPGVGHRVGGHTRAGSCDVIECRRLLRWDIGCRRLEHTPLRANAHITNSHA